MTLIIAEAGVNHNGSKEVAFKLVDAAISSGADIVKFQTFKAKNLASVHARQAEYQIKNTDRKESQYSMLKRLELPLQTHFELLEYCNSKGIEFLSTAFDQPSLDFLINELDLKRLKIPSGELTNAPFVLAHARTQRDLIVSTGMATLSEIEESLGVIAYGYMDNKKLPPSRAAFLEAYSSKEGQELLREKVTILHCTTEYPAPVEEINLNVMNSLKSAFGLQIGYSDHSIGIEIPIAAVAKGATIIEKHFTLDRNMKGPDHKSSLEPEELSTMVKSIRNVESALGSSIKVPTLSENKNKPIARKSIVASMDIFEGQLFSENNITIKRPGTGKQPYDYWSLLGKPASKNYKEDDLI